MPSRKAPDRSSFGSLLSRAARQWRRAADLRLAPFDLTEATWLPLVHIARAPAPPRQKDLAASMSLDGSSVVRLLDNLEAAGLIRRKEGERPAGEDHPADGARPRHRRQGRDGGAPDQGRCADRPVRQGHRDHGPRPAACLPRARRPRWRQRRDRSPLAAHADHLQRHAGHAHLRAGAARGGARPGRQRRRHADDGERLYPRSRGRPARLRAALRPLRAPAGADGGSRALRARRPRRGVRAGRPQPDRRPAAAGARRLRRAGDRPRHRARHGPAAGGRRAGWQ